MTRLILIAMLVGCGGSNDCRHAAIHAFTATRDSIGTSACADLPTTFTVDLAVGNGWIFTEADAVSFSADYVDPDTGCFGYALRDETAGLYHHYVVWLNGREESYVNVVRVGSCVARYSLR